MAKVKFATITKEEVLRKTGISEKEFSRLQKLMSAKIIQAKQNTGFELHGLTVNRLILEYKQVKAPSETAGFVLSLGSKQSKKNIERSVGFVKRHFGSLISQSKVFGDITAYRDKAVLQLTAGVPLNVKRFPPAKKIVNGKTTINERGEIVGFTTSSLVKSWNEVRRHYCETSEKEYARYNAKETHTPKEKDNMLNFINKNYLEHFRLFLKLWKEHEDEIAGSP